MEKSKIKLEINQKLKIDEEIHFKQIKNSQNFTKKKNKIEDEKNDDSPIHKENNKLKEELKELENELAKAKKEIETIKKSNQQEIQKMIDD